MTTDERLAAIQARCEGATPGIHHDYDLRTGKKSLTASPETERFWLFAKNDVEELLALVARQAKVVEAAKDYVVADRAWKPGGRTGAIRFVEALNAMRAAVDALLESEAGA